MPQSGGRGKKPFSKREVPWSRSRVRVTVFRNSTRSYQLLLLSNGNTRRTRQTVKVRCRLASAVTFVCYLTCPPVSGGNFYLAPVPCRCARPVCLLYCLFLCSLGRHNGRAARKAAQRLLLFTSSSLEQRPERERTSSLHGAEGAQASCTWHCVAGDSFSFDLSFWLSNVNVTFDRGNTTKLTIISYTCTDIGINWQLKFQLTNYLIVG